MVYVYGLFVTNTEDRFDLRRKRREKENAVVVENALHEPKPVNVKAQRGKRMGYVNDAARTEAIHIRVQLVAVLVLPVWNPHGMSYQYSSPRNALLSIQLISLHPVPVKEGREIRKRILAAENGDGELQHDVRGFGETLGTRRRLGEEEDVVVAQLLLQDVLVLESRRHANQVMTQDIGRSLHVAAVDLWSYRSHAQTASRTRRSPIRDGFWRRLSTVVVALA